MELKLPELGEGVHEGELIKWNVKVGDTVKEDQVLAEIMTDKATVELPSHHAGKVTEILVKEGDTLHVGQVLMRFEGGKASKVAAPAAAEPVAIPPSVASGPAPAQFSSGVSRSGVSLGGAVTAASPLRTSITSFSKRAKRKNFEIILPCIFNCCCY